MTYTDYENGWILTQNMLFWTQNFAFLIQVGQFLGWNKPISIKINGFWSEIELF